MTRAYQNLSRIRAELGESPGAEAVRAAGASLGQAADRLARADLAIEPVLRQMAGRAVGVGAEDDGSWLPGALDAAMDFAARRGDPERATFVDRAAALTTGTSEAVDAAPAPTGGAGSDALPATFVGELPPESTLDDASVLLVQLEPGDRYGIESLIDIVNRLADDPERPALEREALTRVGRLLTAGSPNQETLNQVGEIFERLASGAPVPESAPSEESPADPTGGPLEEKEEEAEEAIEVGRPWQPEADADVDLLREFLIESRDLLAAGEEALLALEADPKAAEPINVVFRAFHTIKGTSGFLGIEQAAELCHHAESLLSRVREGNVAFDTGVADVSLRSVDVLSVILSDVGLALDGEEPEGATELAQLIRDLQGGGTAGGSAARSEALVRAAADADPSDGGGAGNDSSVRVRTDRLDGLVNLVGELVIAQSMIAQDGVVQDDAQYDLVRKVAHAGKIVRELQDLSMALRMVPLRSTFSKLQRLIRDLSRRSGKRLRLVTEGEDTEIDRTMVDVLGDPLVHMIRNAVDHGIESPEERAAAGKPDMATLSVRSYHAGGNVVVELEDDGRGMNRDRILSKAIERGLIRSAEGLTDAEVWKLVFEPGFSTADRVTEVSGRGVGMDVVRRNVEKLRGRVDVDSTEGVGTRITVRLPLTLAITEGMLMRVGRERYILPTLSIERNVRPTSEMLSTVAGRGEVLLMRDELLPVVRLHALFGIPEGRRNLEDGLLVVIGAADRRCALFVDELLGQQQVVVKSLGSGLGNVEGVTGGAVLGDGTVGLILDPVELVNLARHGNMSPRAA